MPHPERWEEKALGRVARFENTLPETLSNWTYEGFRAIANRAVQGGLKKASASIEQMKVPAKPLVIQNREFIEDGTIPQRIATALGLGITKLTTDKAGTPIENVFTREFYFPDGPSVAATAFGGRVVFDKARGRRMFNACG